MTGETERSPSGWTPDTLKVLEDEKIAAVDRLFRAEIRRLDEALVAQDRAVVLLNTANQIAQDKFEATVERDSVKQNEFRGSLDDLSKLMATRRETESALAAINARVDELTKMETVRLEEYGKQLGDIRSRLDVGPAGLAAIATQQATQQGRQQGVQLAASNLYLLLGIVAAVAALAGHFFAR